MGFQVWAFEQGPYLDKHALRGIDGVGHGICLALSARWAKMRLKLEGLDTGSKGTFSDDGTRTAYFEKQKKPSKNQSIPQLIAEMQAAYTAVQVPAHVIVQSLALLANQINVKMQQDLLANGMANIHDVLDFSDIEEKINAEGAAVEASIKALLRRQKLRVTSETICNSFQDYFSGAQDRACYIFACHEAKHAFAGYFTPGTLGDNYWWFDPNMGEYYFWSESDMKAWMASLQEVFEFDGKATRYQVNYTG